MIIKVGDLLDALDNKGYIAFINKMYDDGEYRSIWQGYIGDAPQDLKKNIVDFFNITNNIITIYMIED